MPEVLISWQDSLTFASILWSSFNIQNYVSTQMTISTRTEHERPIEKNISKRNQQNVRPENERFPLCKLKITLTECVCNNTCCCLCRLIWATWDIMICRSSSSILCCLWMSTVAPIPTRISLVGSADEKIGSRVQENSFATQLGTQRIRWTFNILLL